MHMKNRVIISAAGSGKTTSIVDDALMRIDKKILILTYTIKNLNEIKKKFVRKKGVVPSHITIQSWFSFLLRDGARPYQNYLYDKNRIESIKFVEGKSTRGISKNKVRQYYFQNGKYIYTDKISQFVWECNKLSQNLVIQRLEKIYDVIYIDEVQDLAGYDLEILKLLLSSKSEIVLVGDNRQSTYATNNSSKNSQFKGEKILDFFRSLERKKKCSLKYRTECHRSNQVICSFADSLYPDMPKTVSKTTEKTEHDGLYYILSTDVDRYIEKFEPVILRYDRRTKVSSSSVYNFGEAKGLTFKRVLIMPTKAITEFLENGNLNMACESKAKFYVALTRAKYSVTFVLKKHIQNEFIEHYKFE